MKRYLRWKKHAQSLEELSRQHPLKYLFLEVTRQCNLHCVYCGSNCSSSPNGFHKQIPSAVWIENIRQIAQDFTPGKIMVAITGGEPLTEPHVFDLFKELSRLGFPFGMVTNGVLIDEEVAGRLIETGIGSISVSMDAPPQINDTLRGEGTGRKSEMGIRFLRASGYSGKLEIISTITKPVVRHLEAMRRYVAELRVQHWRIVPVMPIGRASRHPGLIPDHQDIETILDFVRSGRQDGLLPTPEFGEECYLGDRFEGEVRPHLFQCRAGITVGGIMADGRIGACPELGDAFIQGHIGIDRFSNVWNERYEVFRDRSWTRKGVCSNCDAFDRCWGGSLHLYRNTKSDILRCFYLMLGNNREHEIPLDAESCLS